MIYAVYPGSVVDRNNETQTYTYEELIALYGVDPFDCVLGTDVPESRKMFYIHLKPRPDGVYNQIDDLVELGDGIKWGDDFDGKKKYTIETDFDELYADQNSEEKL